MILQGAAQLGRDTVGQPALADQHERVQCVPEAPEMFLLSIGQGHTLIIGLQTGIRS